MSDSSFVTKVKSFLTGHTSMFGIKIPRWVIAALIWVGYFTFNVISASILTLIVMGIWFFWNESKSREKYGLIVVPVIIFLFFFVMYNRELRENDHWPRILIRDVVVRLVAEKQYDASDYLLGEACDEQTTMVSVLNSLKQEFEYVDYGNKLVQCRSYTVNGKVLYWFSPNTFQQFLVLEREPSQYEVVIREPFRQRKAADEMGSVETMPVDHMDVKGNGKDIIFKYTGYNNPLKYLQLEITR